MKLYKTGPVKNSLSIILDHIKWMTKERDFNGMYCAYGLNLKGSEQNEYIGNREFLHYKNLVEDRLKKDAHNSLHYDSITKDKFYNRSIFESNGIPCLKETGIIHQQAIINPNGEVKSLNELFNRTEPFFVKNTILEAGEGVLYCEIVGNSIIVNGLPTSLEEFKSRISQGQWIIQEKMPAHEEIRKINSTALNTTRIVTVLDKFEPVYLSGFQSFATGNQVTDSWNKESIYVGLDVKNSCLKKEGYYNPWIAGKAMVEAHPDSKSRFEGYSVPFLNEAIELCIKAHRILFYNFIIGWDVAITDNGPLIVEANEKPGMSAVQCLDGGLRHKIINYAKNITENKAKL